MILGFNGGGGFSSCRVARSAWYYGNDGEPLLLLTVMYR